MSESQPPSGGVVRKSDLWSGHCFNPRPTVETSPDCYCNCEKIVRAGDARYVHFCGKKSHAGVNCGSRDVYSNNRAIQQKDDPVSCGCTQSQASDDVLMN